MSFTYHESIIGKRRKGSIEDPFIHITADYQVMPNSIIQLAEVPDRFSRVQISDMVEVQEIPDEGLAINEFFVDYATGYIYVHNSLVNESLATSYKGTGTLFLSADRIWVDRDGNTVIKTLGDIIEAGQDALDNVERVEQIISDAEDATLAAQTVADNTKHLKAYSSSTSYVRNNIVSYNGSSYMNITPSQNIVPTNTSYWQIVGLKGDKGDQGVQGLKGNTGDQGIQGLKGDKGDKGDTGSKGDQGIQGLKGDKGDKGDKAVNWKGTYAPATAYKVDDAASYNGSSYICVLASTGNLPTNNTHWNVLAQRGIDGTGSVVSVNHISPDLDGNVELDANDVGAESFLNKGAPNGYASLDSTGNVPANQLGNVEGMEQHGNEWHTEEFETVQGSQTKVDTLAGVGNTKTVKQLDDETVKKDGSVPFTGDPNFNGLKVKNIKYASGGAARWIRVARLQIGTNTQDGGEYATFAGTLYVQRNYANTANDTIASVSFSFGVRGSGGIKPVLFATGDGQMATGSNAYLMRVYKDADNYHYLYYRTPSFSQYSTFLYRSDGCTEYWENVGDPEVDSSLTLVWDKDTDLVQNVYVGRDRVIHGGADADIKKAFSAYGYDMPNSTTPSADLAGIPDERFYIGRVKNKTGYPATYGIITGYRWANSNYGSSWQDFISNTGKKSYRKVSGSAWTDWEEEGAGGGSRTATVVVAANNSSAKSKEGADFIIPNGDTSTQIIINQAIRSLPVGGGKVKLLEGIYITDGDISIPSNVTVEGMGASTIIRKKDNMESSPYCFVNSDSLNGNENIEISNLLIDGNATNNPDLDSDMGYGYTLRFSRVKNSTIRDLTMIDNYHYFIDLVYSDNNLIDNVVITGNTDLWETEVGIRLYISNYNTVSNVTIDGTYNSNMMLSSAHGNKLIGNSFMHSREEGALHLNSSNRNVISGNHVNGGGMSNTIFYISVSHDNVISNNTICDSYREVIFLSQSQRNAIVGNTINNNLGIAVDVLHSSENSITGNTLHNNNSAVRLTGNSHRNIVTGNSCIRGTGTAGNYSASQYTIWISGTTATNNFITSNTCLGKAVVIGGGTGNTEVNNKVN